MIQQPIIVLDNQASIRFYQLLVWRAALSLEIKGLRRSGSRQVSTIIREQLGLTGTKATVLTKLEAHIEKERARSLV